MKKSLLAMVLVMMSGAVLAADAEAKVTRVGPAIGFTAGGDVENAFAYGVQAEVGFGENLGIELSYMRFSNENDVDGFPVDMNHDTIGLSALARNNLVQDLSGYILAGLDYNLISSGPDVDNEAGLHLGLGFNIQGGDFTELFFDFRYTFLKLTGNVPENDSWGSDFGILKMGLNFLL